MKYKALLLDVDGTLVRQDQSLSKQVVESLSLIKGRVKVGVCTGRPYFTFNHYLQQLDLHGLHIALGGAQLVEFPSEKVLYQQGMKGEVVKEIYGLMSGRGRLVILQDEKYQYQDLRRILDPNFPADYRPVKVLKDWGVPKMMVYGVDKKDWRLLKKYEGLNVAKAFYPGLPLDFAAITALNINKQSAVLKWAKLAGIKPEEVVGVGDGYNDVPLLNACGVGVAMGNGVEELKQMADFVAPSVDEDGLVTVIEKFF